MRGRRHLSACVHSRVSPGEAAEDGAGHQARAAGVVVEEEAADDFAGGIEAGNRAAGRVFDLGVAGDLEAAEGEGDAGRHGIGLVGRLVEALGPIALVDREAARRSPSRMFGLNGASGRGAALKARTVSRKRRGSTPSSRGAKASKLSAFSLVMRGMRYSSRNRWTTFWSKICQANMPGWFRISPPYLA